MKHWAWPNVYNAFVLLEIQQNRLIFGTIDQKDMFLLFIKKMHTNDLKGFIFCRIVCIYFVQCEPQ